MSSREEILASIRQHTQTRYDKPDIADMKRLSYPDKIEQFCAISRAVGGTAVVLGEGEDVNTVIRRTYPFIPGPIGINLGMAHAPEKYYDNLSACSLCMSCSDVCPVKVDLAEQIYKWRQDLDGLGKANTGKKIMSGGMKFLMERPALFNAALWAAPVVNGLPRFMKYNDLDDWGKGRELPEFASESFNEMWKKNKVQGKEESK